MNHERTNDAKAPEASDCSSLDAYLDDELASRDAAAFEAHIAKCAQCAEAVDQQRWINDLLRSAESAEVEAAPTWAIASTKSALQRRRRRRVAVAAASLRPSPP